MSKAEMHLVDLACFFKRFVNPWSQICTCGATTVIYEVCNTPRLSFRSTASMPTELCPILHLKCTIQCICLSTPTLQTRASHTDPMWAL